MTILPNRIKKTEIVSFPFAAKTILKKQFPRNSPVERRLPKIRTVARPFRRNTASGKRRNDFAGSRGRGFGDIFRESRTKGINIGTTDIHSNRFIWMNPNLFLPLFSLSRPILPKVKSSSDKGFLRVYLCCLCSNTKPPHSLVLLRLFLKPFPSLEFFGLMIIFLLILSWLIFSFFVRAEVFELLYDVINVPFQEVLGSACVG